jgi:cytochrome c5
MPWNHHRGAGALRFAFALLLAGCATSGPTDSPSGAAEPGGVSATPAAAQPAVQPQPAAQPEAAAEPPDPPPAGIFTEAQADRGGTTFDEVCSECHTTSEFRGRTFQSNWGRRTVYSLFRTVRSTMPDDNPGGLDEQVYLDVVAYILSMNGHDTGSSELAADSPMREVRIAPPDA